MLNITKYIIALASIFMVTTSYAASALDVSPICKKVGKDLDSYINRGAHCLESEPFEIPLTDAKGLNVGTAKVVAYVYSDNPKNALTWTFKYEWVVTIRCGLLSENKMRLYAGAGIVEGSDAEAEWLETEAKMQTMLNILNTKIAV